MLASAVLHAKRPVRWAQQVGIGFAFWLVFLLILQSGNAARSAAAGFGEEALRILAASALASLSALILVPLAARYPVRGPEWARHLAGAAATGALIAALLVVIAWAGAPLILSPDNPRLSAPLTVQLAADAPILAFAIVGFMLLLQIPLPVTAAAATNRVASQSFLIRSRHGLARIDAAQIDWVESQENYVALHCGDETHLLRETLTALEYQLDPTAFVRIHRRTIVNRARLRAIRPLPGGDAMATLSDGTELRVSRTYAAQVRDAMSQL